MLTEHQRRRDALTWLAVVRRVDADKALAGAYLTGLADLPAWAVETACREIGYRPRVEYEDKWPELGAIRAVALAAMRAAAERTESARLLEAPGDRADPARLAQLLADVKAEIARKAMQ